MSLQQRRKTIPGPYPVRRIGNPSYKTLAVALCAGLLWCESSPAQSRLFEQEPYDLIVLTKTHGGTEHKIRPLPQRPLPEDPPPRSKLTVRLLDSPDAKYQVAWAAIDREKTRLFEELVLDEANTLVAAKQFEEAYDYFSFLERRPYKPPGLTKAFHDYLYAEAGALHGQKKYDAALARLWELHRRNPTHGKLNAALGMTTDQLVSQYLAKKDYRSARRLLGSLAAAFPQHATVAKHRHELSREAEVLLAEARIEAGKGNYRRAFRLQYELVRIWPMLPGAEQFAQEIHAKHPRVVVGVCVPAIDPRPGGLNGWAARRSSRLLYRTLTEFAGAGTEGGNYVCPVGQLEIEELEGRLSLTVDRNVGWSSGDALLTGYDVSRRLLAMTRPGDPAYRVDWAELLAGVDVSGVYRVSVTLHHPHVRGDALLQTMLVPYTDSASPWQGASPVPNGPYLEELRAEGSVYYQRNPNYFAGGEGRPAEIAERYYAQGAKAVEALQQGKVDVLDRVNPWNVQVSAETISLRKGIPGQKLVVDRYRLPLVHCLIPNMRKPRTARRTFRRALVYAIHRRAILDQLTGGAELPGCEVVSGPFPPGFSLSDPIGYAHDNDIEPRTYDPRLAVALATIALRDLDRQKKPEAESLAKIPPLVLAHPIDEIAAVACRSIKRQLELIKIPVKLQPFAGPAPTQIPPDVDLLYAELAIWEPVVDARRLLGEQGMAAGCSPYMSLALRRLEEAGTWPRVSAILRDIHRIAHDDLAVIPLWQLTDYFAYREALGGIGDRPLSLYQNVERWQLAFRYAGDQQ